MFIHWQSCSGFDLLSEVFSSVDELSGEFDQADYADLVAMMIGI